MHVTYPWDKSWGAVSLWDIFPRGNYVGNKSLEMQFFSRPIFRGILTGGKLTLGLLSGCNNPEPIIQGVILLGPIFLGSNYPPEQLSGEGGQLSRGQFSLRAIILWGSCLGSNYLGGNYLGHKFTRGQLSGHPTSHVLGRL